MTSRRPRLNPRPPVTTLAITLAILAAALAPPAAAQAGASGAAAATSRAESVGTFDVAPVSGDSAAGQARGSVVAALVADGGAEASGRSVLRDVTVATGGRGDASARVFTSVDIAGFTPVARLQGVGTSSLTLRGEGVTVSLTDTVNSLLVVRATGSGEQTVTFSTPSDVRIQKSASTDNVWTVSGAVRGAFILVSASGEAAADAASSLVVESENKATATLRGSAQLVFRADSTYEGGAGVDAYNRAVVQAIARGRIAAETATEFASGAPLLASAQYFSTVAAGTEANARSRVTTSLWATASAAAQGSGGHVVAYDLDYVDVPARDPSQVVVYVNGALATRVDGAAQVNERAQAGTPCYYATTASGRVLVLASTATRAAASTVTVGAVPEGVYTPRTLAQLDAQTGVTTVVRGSYAVLGDLAAGAEGSGQVLGSFNSFFASEAKGDAKVAGYTDVRSSTEVFALVDFAADATAEARAHVEATARAQGQAAQSVRMDTSVAGRLVAQATFTDSVFSTIRAEAHEATRARFVLSQDVRAETVTEGLVRLQGPSGTIGHLILVNADAAASSASRLDLSAVGEVQARLAAGASVVYRAAAEGQAQVNAEVIARAIAAGEVVSEVSAGAVENAVVAADVDYTSRVDVQAVADAAATRRGRIALDVTSRAQQSAALVLDADRAVLPAVSADDIQVFVDGKAAERVSAAADVLAAVSAAASTAASAKYHVATNVQGQTQVLLAIPGLAADAGKRVVVESRLEAESRLNAALDVFGSFRPGFGGAATGSIVSLVAKQDAGLLLDYTVAAKPNAQTSAATTLVFDAVKVGASAFQSASASGAHSLRFASDEAVVEVHDASSAVLKVTATADTVATFDLGPNIVASELSTGVLMLSSADFSGALILADAAGGAVTGASFETAGSAQATVTARLEAGSQVIFKAFSGFESELTQAQKEAQAKAIASGQLLGQVIVDSNAQLGTTATSSINYYQSVEAAVAVATTERVELVLNSATSAGKSVIVSLDRETVSGLIRGDGRLLVDGKAVARAASYEDALTPDGDKYWLITTDGEVGLQAIVTLSHFSTRTITVETPAPPSIFLWTTIGLGIVVIGQAVYPRLRRKW